MNFQVKERWDIYVNGTDGVKQTTLSMLTLWRALFPACGLFGETLVEFLGALLKVVLILVLPLLFWLAPLISIFTAHRRLTDDEVRAILRKDMHRNGSSL